MFCSTPRRFSFVDFLSPAGEDFLSDVTLDVPDSLTFIFRAKLHGPAGSSVWARAWISNQAEGTLAEASSPQLLAGDLVTLTVKLSSEKTPDQAYIRIESAPLNSQHVVGTRLT